MATPDYPSTLPGPGTYTLEPSAQVLATDNEQGPKDFRRRSRQPNALAPVTFRFLEDDFTTFVEWWKTTLKYGHKWFWIQLPSAGGITWHVARFSERYVAKLDGHRYWNVTALLEIHDRRFEPFDRGGTSYTFVEDFENGFDAYVLILGSLTPFRIITGMTAHCMHADNYTASTQAIIERTLGYTVRCDVLSLRFRVTSFGTDDALVLALRNGATDHFILVPCREGFYDGPRRAMVLAGGALTPVTPAQVVLNRVYTLRAVFAPGTLQTRVEVIDETTGAVLQTTMFTKAPFDFDRIRFTLDPSVTTCETDYDDIFVTTNA